MAGYPAAPAFGPPPPALTLLSRKTRSLALSRRIPKVPAPCTWLSVIQTGCPPSAWPRMASALVDMNRLPLRRKGETPEALVRSTLTPWTAPVMVELVTEMAVLLDAIPSALIGPSVLRATTRPKLEEP